MLKELENSRNRALIRIVAWVLKNQDRRIGAVELSKEIDVSISSVKSALQKLDGNILLSETHGKTRIFWVNKPALLQSLKEDGLCFCEVGQVPATEG